ncbi:hypothetical protein [Nocardioides sp.]|uniref:hypothetical protein n=1 Tax=Nocardioides sp. TaxID=35761 RepID=UPI003561AE95
MVAEQAASGPLSVNNPAQEVVVALDQWDGGAMSVLTPYGRFAGFRDPFGHRWLLHRSLG